MPMFTLTSYQDEVARLQDELRDALRSRDRDAEIGALLAIGNAALDEAPELAFGHFKLAEKAVRRARRPQRLHEALGGQAMALRLTGDVQAAIDRFLNAERAAGEAGNTAGQVRWMLNRASLLRTMRDLDRASGLIDEAERLLRPPGSNAVARMLGPVNLFDKEQVVVLAELEGQHGVTCNRARDEQGAEDHYRSAAFFAEMAGDSKGIATWSGNVGNTCVRRQAFSDAIEWYEKAVDAAIRTGQTQTILSAATGLMNGFARACRHEEGGDRLRALADQAPDSSLKMALLDRALEMYDQGIYVDKGLQTAREIETLANGAADRPDFLNSVISIREKMERSTAEPAEAPPPDAPTALDLYLSDRMSRAERSRGNLDMAVQAAHRVCDVRLALALAGGKAWKRIVDGDMLRLPGYDLQVVFDTLRMLFDADRFDAAIDLLQRYKAPGFCVPTLSRLKAEGAPTAESAAYLQAVDDLCREVEALAGPATPDFFRVVNAVGRASARMYEAGEALRAGDPILAARLGAPVQKDDLIDALPYAGGVAIVDFLVGSNATILMMIGRGNAGVVAFPIMTPSFTAEHAQQLLDLYREGNLPKQLGGAQAKALMEIAQLLHDNLFCGLARELAARGVNQLILVPDVLTRNLPLHLSLACGEEINVPGVDTQGANFLCEVMPIEYAPCVQAVATSQVYQRPKRIERIAAFADPAGDLTVARVAMEEFGAHSGDPGRFFLRSGADVTKAAVTEEVRTSDVVMFATHGVFSPGQVEESRLLLHDEPWRMTDMARIGELDKRALMVLMACEVGAIAPTPDDCSAWGIPGALISTGASAVVANLWPVEDVTSNVLAEAFLKHLGHRGYRPAAAMFRAVRDLRRMTRDEALARCRDHIAVLKAANAPGRALLGARSLLEWIEDEGMEHPFEHPYFWGATVVFGSGWHLPAGASVGPAMNIIENRLKQESVDALLAESKAAEALAAAKAVADSSDGLPRGRAYTTMAVAMLRLADPSTEARLRRQASRLLAHASRIAAREDDEELRARVAWASAQMEDGHVV